MLRFQKKDSLNGAAKLRFGSDYDHPRDVGACKEEGTRLRQDYGEAALRIGVRQEPRELLRE